MTPEALRALLQKYNLRPNFTYGQNFLLDDIVLQDTVDAAGVTKDDAVLEIGPGIGNLTRLLCQRAGLVLSVEKDPKMLPILKSLKKEFKSFHYELADVLEYDYQKFFREQGRERYKVVANIPYYITGKIIQMLLAAKHRPSSITLLVQKEVAKNLVAKPGNLNVLAISVQLYADVEMVQKVLARSFYPAPKVDSAVVHLTVHDHPRYELRDEKKFFGVVKSCFAGKRKQIHNTLKNNLKVEKETVDEILRQAGISPEARPQELAIDDWIRLVNIISDMGLK